MTKQLRFLKDVGRPLRELATATVAWTPFAIVVALGAALAQQNYQDIVGPVEPVPPRAESYKPIIYEQGIQALGTKDDRVPLLALSEEYGLQDANLPAKLSSVGAIFTPLKDRPSAFSRGTGALLGRRDFVVTAAHLFTGMGWQASELGQAGITIYIPVCDRSYPITDVYIKTTDPTRNIKLDYAFLKLGVPACEEAKPFQAATLTDEAVTEMAARHYPLLSLSTFRPEDTARAEEFPNALEVARAQAKPYLIYGVFCRFTDVANNIAGPSDALFYRAEGCDTYPGNSGGPLLVSLDAGRSYKLIGTLYGCRGAYSCYPRIKGVYASDLETHFAKWAADASSAALNAVQIKLGGAS